MALPINPIPATGQPGQPTPPPVVGGVQPPAPIPVQPTLPTQPNQPLAGPNLDEELIKSGKGDHLIAQQNLNLDNSKYSQSSEYAPIGSLSAADVIKNSYKDYYKPYENHVINAKYWLQDKLTQENRTEDLAKARIAGRTTKQFNTIKNLLDRALVGYLTTNKVPPKDIPTITSLVLNEILGYGPIEPLWSEPAITEIMVNGPSSVYIEIGGKIRKAHGVQFRDREHLLETIQQILTPLNKTLDTAHPAEDGRLPDGSRINATHWSVTPGGPSLTIRRFPETVYTIRKMVELGAMTEEIATEIGNMIYYGCSTLISGGTGSGKTSLLNALSGAIPPDERIVTIEDNLELRLHPARHVLAHEARGSRTDDGRGAFTIRDHVKNALRQRPDRIVVGEIRDATALDFINALSTGHDGSLGTVHANNAVATIDRLIGLVLQAGEMENLQAMTMIGFSIDIIVNVKRYADGSRRIAEIAEVPSTVNIENGSYSLTPKIIWKFVETGEEDGKIVGEYKKVNEWSENLIQTKALHVRKRLSYEDILKISEQEVTPQSYNK